MSRSMLRKSLRLLVVAVLGLALTACGGGGGDLASVGTGGTGTVPSTISVGQISGFGSVIVTGVRFADDAAAISDEDGNPRSRADLKLGMVAAVTGSADFTAGTGVATAIRYGSEVLGPVEQVDLASGSFRVLGARVLVKAATVFDERLAGLAALQAGQTVEVFGFYNALAGSYTATRIGLVSTPSAFKLRAPVESLDSENRRFNLAGVQIDYSGLPLAQVSALRNGSMVRVSAGTPPLAGRWRVDALNVAARAVLAEGEAKIEGTIAEALSATRFVVDGVPVDVSAANMEGVPAVGRRVEVKGRVQAGVLFAEELEVEDEDSANPEAFEISGVVENFHPVTRRFLVHGQTVDASRAGVVYEEGSAAALGNGRSIELKGYFDPVDGAVIATRIHFKD